MKMIGALLLAASVFFAREAAAAGRPPIDEQVPSKLKRAAFGLG